MPETKITDEPELLTDEESGGDDEVPVVQMDDDESSEGSEFEIDGQADLVELLTTEEGEGICDVIKNGFDGVRESIDAHTSILEKLTKEIQKLRKSQ